MQAKGEMFIATACFPHWICILLLEKQSVLSEMIGQRLCELRPFILLYFMHT